MRKIQDPYPLIADKRIQYKLKHQTATTTNMESEEDTDTKEC